MRTLVIGGSGNVGTEVVKRFVALGEDVSIMTPASAPRRPAGSRVVYGDFHDAKSVRAAMHEARRVFLLIPQSPNETERGLEAIESARAAGVQRLVYMSVCMPAFARDVPHFASKQQIERAVLASRIPCTIVRPNNFFQNDLAFSDAMLKYGVYPQPIGGVGLARVDVRDIADVTTLALTREGHEGQIYDVNGPATLTGASCAAIYSRELGRDVRYAGDSLDAWSASVNQVLPAWLVGDLRRMYDQFQRHRMASTPEADERLACVLGRRPRSFEAFVAELARAAPGSEKSVFA